MPDETTTPAQTEVRGRGQTPQTHPRQETAARTQTPNRAAETTEATEQETQQNTPQVSNFKGAVPDVGAVIGTKSQEHKYHLKSSKKNWWATSWRSMIIPGI
jgi:hypothetical protein